MLPQKSAADIQSPQCRKMLFNTHWPFAAFVTPSLNDDSFYLSVRHESCRPNFLARDPTCANVLMDTTDRHAKHLRNFADGVISPLLQFEHYHALHASTGTRICQRRMQRELINYASGGHGIRTRNPLRGTTFPVWPLAIRLPSTIVSTAHPIATKVHTFRIGNNSNRYSFKTFLDKNSLSWRSCISCRQRTGRASKPIATRTCLYRTARNRPCPERLRDCTTALRKALMANSTQSNRSRIRKPLVPI